MGLGSAANLPVIDGAGVAIGTINLLAGPGHFTPERLTVYQSEIAARLPALIAGLSA